MSTDRTVPELVDAEPKCGACYRPVSSCRNHPECVLARVEAERDRLRACVAELRSLVVSDINFSRAEVVRILNRMMEGA